MIKGMDVIVRQTASGFIVEPHGMLNKDPGRQHAASLTFPNIESLTGWISVHFSRAEPVRAPMGVDAMAKVLTRGFNELRDRPVESSDWPEPAPRDRLDP